ncbi:MAG: hypothetical protein WC506_02285 [Candidatus Micrarchaeia archaeon]
MSETFNILDRQWKSTCRLVFGGEVGTLADYQKWLSQRADPIYYFDSAITGKQVAFASNNYAKGSKRISLEEVDFGKKFEPVPINDMKDVESLFQAVSDRAYYAGNVILGNSKFIEKSTNISDSFYVYGSSRMGDSKYIAHSSMGRLCEYVFGSAAPGESSYLVRCNDTYHVKRAFELWMTANSSDCHYVFALNNCAECMFCFNLRGVRHAIGNTPLPKDKYLKIKAMLLEQMRDELKAKKSLPSLTEMLARTPDHSRQARELLAKNLPPGKPEKTSMEPMEKAFSHASKVLFGVELSGLGKYRPWLARRMSLGERRKSIFSDSYVYVGDYAKYFEIPRHRTVMEREALKLVELMPPQQGIEKITMDSAPEFLADIAYFALEYHDGPNSNLIDCMATAYSSNVCQSGPCVQIKDSAYNLWPRTSEYVFGCGVLFDSSFCMHCYQSVKLTRCFEVDASRDCSDCYFCHNCENVHDSMFCFNAKNLKYAIGNVELGREKYPEVKAKILAQIGASLLKEKDFAPSIYAAGAGK